MKKAISIIISLFAVIIGFAESVRAADQLPVAAYFFYGDGCPHCREELLFLNELRTQFPTLKIAEFEIYQNAENMAIMEQTAKKLGATVNGVPFLAVGGRYFIGYASGATSEQIRSRVAECVLNPCPDPIAEIFGAPSGDRQADEAVPKEMPAAAAESVNASGPAENDRRKSESLDVESEKEIDNNKDKKGILIEVPFLGQIDTASFSLPAITVLMGALDGFNPCAMWALVFLISLLLGIKNKKRMWILGSAFIAASAFVYFIFMAAWLNLILFFGFIIWVRLAIAGLALAGGIYAIRDFFVNKTGGCKVSGDEKRRLVFDRLKASVYRQSFWLALGGIVILAFAVNLVELVCSAGLPAVYSQVLALSNVPEISRYAYLALYVLVFMLDDLFVFFAAMITMELTGITTKYARFSRLAGGITLFLIGNLLIFKPEWLMFG